MSNSRDMDIRTRREMVMSREDIALMYAVKLEAIGKKDKAEKALQIAVYYSGQKKS